MATPIARFVYATAVIADDSSTCSSAANRPGPLCESVCVSGVETLSSAAGGDGGTAGDALAAWPWVAARGASVVISEALLLPAGGAGGALSSLVSGVPAFFAGLFREFCVERGGGDGSGGVATRFAETAPVLFATAPWLTASLGCFVADLLFVETLDFAVRLCGERVAFEEAPDGCRALVGGVLWLRAEERPFGAVEGPLVALESDGDDESVGDATVPFPARLLPPWTTLFRGAAANRDGTAFGFGFRAEASTGGALPVENGRGAARRRCGTTSEPFSSSSTPLLLLSRFFGLASDGGGRERPLRCVSRMRSTLSFLWASRFLIVNEKSL